MKFCQVKTLDNSLQASYNDYAMEKLKLLRLWDLYGGLLTENQREICKMYFELDLTVSEIAEQKCISRQGVSECLALCKKQLEEYENVLRHGKVLEEIALWADGFIKLHPEYAADIAHLKEISENE